MTFVPWKTIKLGLHKNPDEYHEALKKAGQNIGSRADDILGKIPYSPEEVELDLVSLSFRDLGFRDGDRYADICAKALELGLELCPAEAGPALRLQYADQPPSELASIAMEAIIGRSGDYRIFTVGHVGWDHWLVTSSGRPDHVCDTDGRIRFVFVLPRK